MTKAPVTFSTAKPNPDFHGVEDIDAEELKTRSQEVHIIDVRGPDEFTGELGHIAGAKLIVLNSIPEQMDEIPKSGTIVFVCRSGSRSAQATTYARENGVKNAYNMRGGMLRWNQLGYPIDK